MSLDDLGDDVETAYAALGDELAVSLDRETKNELALLETALDPDDTDELVRRAVHMLFQTTVDTGKLDFQLRSGFDVTYDEYLMGVTRDTYNEQMGYTPTEPDDERRYQF